LPWAGGCGKAGPALFENVGNNNEPAFRSPIRMKCWQKEMTLCAHEHSFAAVDWYGAGKLDLICGAESGLFYFFRRSVLDNPAPPSAQLGDPIKAQ